MNVDQPCCRLTYQIKQVDNLFEKKKTNSIRYPISIRKSDLIFLINSDCRAFGLHTHIQRRNACNYIGMKCGLTETKWLYIHVHFLDLNITWFKCSWCGQINQILVDFVSKKPFGGIRLKRPASKKKNTRNTTENIDLIPPKDFELILMWHIVYIKTRWQNRHNTKKKNTTN